MTRSDRYRKVNAILKSARKLPMFAYELDAFEQAYPEFDGRPLDDWSSTSILNHETAMRHAVLEWRAANPKGATIVTTKG